MELLENSYFALFVIVALGYMLGSIKIKGVSLDVSAVIFIALLFGHFGVVIPKDLQNFGMILFIFTIGIQAGPGFLDSFKSKGRDLALLTTSLKDSVSLVRFISHTYTYEQFLWVQEGCSSTERFQRRSLLKKKQRHDFQCFIELNVQIGRAHV